MVAPWAIDVCRVAARNTDGTTIGIHSLGVEAGLNFLKKGRIHS
jgi:hypothetical protein